MERRFLFCAVAYWQLFEASVRRPNANVVRSVLFSQHDCDYTLGDRRITWVGRVRSECLIEIIDLEKDRLSIDLERPKVMFLVWVIGVAEIIVHGNCFDDASNGFGAEGRDTGGDEGRTDSEVLAQFVVERAMVLVFVVIVGSPDLKG
jgi:hypothetical protein